MLITFMLMGPVVIFAGVLQHCLNQLIAKDRQAFNRFNESVDDVFEGEH